MKRISAWLLTLLMLASVAGCGAPPPQTALPPAAGSTVGPAAAGNAVADKAPAPIVPPPTEIRQESMSAPPMNALPPEKGPERITYQVERDLVEKTVQTEDGIRLAEVRYQLPLLQAVGADGAVVSEGVSGERARALEVTAAFNEGFDAWRQTNADLEQVVNEDYAFRPEMFRMGMYYVDELDFSVWQTERLVSIRGDSYSYYGGAHPNTQLLGWNFDVVTGTYIHVLSIGSDEQAFRALVAEELTLLAEERALELQQEPAAMYWEDYPAILQNWNEHPVSFDTAGMTVRFSPYELGSYAAGAHEFTISYAFLEPHLSDYGRELLGLTMAG